MHLRVKSHKAPLEELGYKLTPYACPRCCNLYPVKSNCVRHIKEGSKKCPPPNTQAEIDAQVDTLQGPGLGEAQIIAELEKIRQKIMEKDFGDLQLSSAKPPQKPNPEQTIQPAENRVTSDVSSPQSMTMSDDNRRGSFSLSSGSMSLDSTTALNDGDDRQLKMIMDNLYK